MRRLWGSGRPSVSSASAATFATVADAATAAVAGAAAILNSNDTAASFAEPTVVTVIAATVLNSTEPSGFADGCLSAAAPATTFDLHGNDLLHPRRHR